MDLPLNRLTQTLRDTGIGRFLQHYADAFPQQHLKDISIDAMGPGREVVIQGRRIVNFGSDSFLGLDRDPRVQAALRQGIDRWGTHSGASRAFAGVRVNAEVEDRLADWLGTEATLLFPSVSLVNLGVIPGLVGKADFIAVDELAHNSVQDGVRLARGFGARTASFAHSNPNDLERVLSAAAPYRFSMVCVDGVYSMSGTLPPLADLAAVCRRYNAFLYVDDAHGTGVIGPHGVGVVREVLGHYDNTLVVGSLSKAFSCLGGFIGCPIALKQQLKMRSNTYIFGGPVAPCYLDAILVVLQILQSTEYNRLIGALHARMQQFCQGARQLGYEVGGTATPIISVLIGDEDLTLKAGRFLFDRGYYVQSVIFPAVPYHAGVLRVQINANHSTEQIAGLLFAFAALHQAMPHSSAA